MSQERERFLKRDRAARLTRVATLLYPPPPRTHRAGDSTPRQRECAHCLPRLARRRVRVRCCGVGGGGRWVCEQSDFLPPLKLTLLEAVTLFLSARLMARYADKKDPHMFSAFGKLASVLPVPLAAHVHTTVAAMADGKLDRHYARVFEAVATAWATSHKVRISYSRRTSTARSY